MVAELEREILESNLSVLRSYELVRYERCRGTLQAQQISGSWKHGWCSQAQVAIRSRYLIRKPILTGF